MVTAAMVPEAKGEQDMHYPALRGVCQGFPDNKTTKTSGFVALKSSVSRQTCSRSCVWPKLKGGFPGAKTTKLTACRFASSDVERLLHVVRLVTAVCVTRSVHPFHRFGRQEQWPQESPHVSSNNVLVNPKSKIVMSSNVGSWHISPAPSLEHPISPLTPSCANAHDRK